ncbi:hypothetical protein JQ609_10695 [Bradyrhizobium sp. AUGA SZCCT0169]|uniref:hypothetical protein n=1 Tax=Bradyrhizobium sp. AUGA SZCCT0169 TaxID=2807663 RepID=UPI001BAB6372|nr:hypothetical protein [Bradyrhizobium sp. AUGA SZCCT0169]MBR1247402.1 hypothetical protein [Bradyrhizobium sp. AUGA SZCCT0169]
MPTLAKKFHENQYLGKPWQLEGAAQLRVVFAGQPIRRQAGMAEVAARAIDLEFGDRLFVSAAPQEDIPAAALGCRKIS